MVAGFYGHDIPGTLSVQLQERFDLPPNQWEYLSQAFFSVYSIPNIIFPVLIGYLIDAYLSDAAWVAILSTTMFSGHLMFVLGVQMQSIWFTLFSRIFAGIGQECISIAASRIIAKWFCGKEFQFALGFAHSSAMMGAITNDLLSPYLAENFGLTSSLNGFIMFSFAGYLLSFVLAKVDRDRAKQQSYEQVSVKAMEDANGLPVETSASTSKIGELDDQSSNNSKVKSCSHLRRFFSQVKSVPSLIWLLCVVMVLQKGPVIPFISFHQPFFQSRYFPDDPERAAQAMAIPDIIVTILVPVIGYIGDKLGHRMELVALGSLWTGINYYVLGTFTPKPLLLMLISLGIGFSLNSFTYSVFPVMANTANIGTIVGLLAISRNFGWVIVPPIAAQFVIWDPTYSWVLVFFSGMLSASLGMAYVVWALDRRWNGTPGILEIPEKDRARRAVTLN